MNEPYTVSFMKVRQNLNLFPFKNETVFISDGTVQLKEGCRYEYELPKGYRLKAKNGVISESRKKNEGLIETGIFVGLLKLVLIDASEQEVDTAYIEVRSVKINYADEYRTMLEEISDKAVDLLTQLDSPVEQSFNPEDTNDEATLVQRFYFLKSLVDNSDFQEAVHRVTLNPNTQWLEHREQRAISSCGRLGKFEVRQIAASGRRLELPQSHPLKTSVSTVPELILTRDKRDCVDTPENRFVKYALTVFELTLDDIRQKLSGLLKKNGEFRYPGVIEEIEKLCAYFEEIISEDFFRAVSRPKILPLSSPVLQNKDAYRQVLRAWLQFELAAKLSWHGGDDIYEGGKRDIATLYEYWGFFKLLDIVCELFELDHPPAEDLIQESSNGLGLQLKQGRALHIKGEYSKSGRPLAVKFSFNRTFSGGQSYPSGGSWTKMMRPDYTLSLWPVEFSEESAEKQELISHIHFDAKYKVNHLNEMFGTDTELEDLSEEDKQLQRKGTYKRVDLLKMHAYRDAIRRTAGAYILYPGTEEQKPMQGFHELLPGLGAFPLRPQINDGSSNIKDFLKEVVAHVSNRASQYERKSYHRYNVHKDEPRDEIRELLPEKEDYLTRVKPVTEQNVLVDWYKNDDHLEWILKNKLFNCRTGTQRGSLKLSADVTGADYLLLHSTSELNKLTKIYQLVPEGPRIMASERLKNLGYGKASKHYYLVFKLKSIEPAFGNISWDLSGNDSFKGRSSAEPQAIKLSELMKYKKK